MLRCICILLRWPSNGFQIKENTFKFMLIKNGIPYLRCMFYLFQMMTTYNPHSPDVLNVYTTSLLAWQNRKLSSLRLINVMVFLPKHSHAYHLEMMYNSNIFTPWSNQREVWLKVDLDDVFIRVWKHVVEWTLSNVNLCVANNI